MDKYNIDYSLIPKHMREIKNEEERQIDIRDKRDQKLEKWVSMLGKGYGKTCKLLFNIMMKKE